MVEVELVLALSGRPLAYKTFSMPKDRGRALGSLIAMGTPYETDKDKKYSYFFSLEDGRIIHCEEKVYRNIFDYAWDQNFLLTQRSTAWTTSSSASF